MTITDNRKNPTINFENIEGGEIFFSPETNRFYIRIDTIYSDNKVEMYNAVDLSEGYPVWFDEDETVERVRANITITNP